MTQEESPYSLHYTSGTLFLMEGNKNIADEMQLLIVQKQEIGSA